MLNPKKLLLIALICFSVIVYLQHCHRYWGLGGPCPPQRLLVLPISVYSKYFFGTLRNDKTTDNKGKGNTFKDNSRLKFSRLFAKFLATNCCT